jgi:23S rRNA (adenine2503-C2)-methyltransferase
MPDPVEETPATPPPADTLLSLDSKQLAERFVALGGKPFHARIAREQVLRHGHTDYAPMTSLPAALREALAAELPILSSREVDRSVARDKTTKLLMGFPRVGGAEATIETVHIPPISSKSTKGATLCVSTQVGCPVACPFCASGQLGLVRNLAAHEIIEQYVRGRALGEISRSVVMGIGEPLLNYENLTIALDAVHDEMGLGSRKITVSTVGFPDRLRRAADSGPRFQLAISLHTPFDDQRDELVPAMKGTPIADVIAAADYWFEVTGREVTYEYVLLGGENDTVDHARALADRLWGKRCSVNLIPYNPIKGDTYYRPHPEDVESFREFLEDAGRVATVRWSRGLEGDAACGQLRARNA